MSLEGHREIRHHFFRFKNTELNEIYFTMSLRSFAASLVAIFTPIYLYLNGISFRNIMLFYMAMYFTEAIFEYPAAVGIKKFGPKKMIAISLPLLVLYFWLLKTLPVYHWPLLFLSFVGGFLLSLFWQAYHFDFSKSEHKKQSGSEISRLYIILTILSAIAPFIGGFIATKFGIDILYILVMILLAIAMIPLLAKGEKYRSDEKFNFKKIKISEIKNDLLSYVGDGWEGTVGAVFWPLFIYLIVESYEGVGLLTSIALLLTVIVTYFVGKRSDQGQRQKYLKYGGFLSGVIYFIQTLAYTATHIFYLNIIRGFSSSMFTTPFVSEYYLHADERSRSEYIYAMETIIDVGRIILFGVMALMTYIFSTKEVLIIALLFGGIGSIMTTMMPPAKSEINCMGAKIKITPQPKKL